MPNKQTNKQSSRLKRSSLDPLGVSDLRRIETAERSRLEWRVVLITLIALLGLFAFVLVTTLTLPG